MGMSIVTRNSRLENFVLEREFKGLTRLVLVGRVCAFVSVDINFGLVDFNIGVSDLPSLYLAGYRGVGIRAGYSILLEL